MRFFTSFRMTIFHFKVIATQPLDRAIQRKEMDYPVKPDNDNHLEQNSP
jgi:hypothetical protein